MSPDYGTPLAFKHRGNFGAQLSTGNAFKSSSAFRLSYRPIVSSIFSLVVTKVCSASSLKQQAKLAADYLPVPYIARIVRIFLKYPIALDKKSKFLLICACYSNEYFFSTSENTYVSMYSQITPHALSRISSQLLLTRVKSRMSFSRNCQQSRLVLTKSVRWFRISTTNFVQGNVTGQYRFRLRAAVAAFDRSISSESSN